MCLKLKLCQCELYHIPYNHYILYMYTASSSFLADAAEGQFPLPNVSSGTNIA